MPLPRLSDRQVQAFKHVMESGTVTGAAQRMLTAQPGVTRLLKQLEHDVGFTLFERVRGRLVPTPEARIFYREVARVWTGTDHLRETARRIREREVGGLRISAMPLLGMTFIPDVLAEFATDHPDASLELSTYRSAQVIDEVITQRCDVGFAIVAEGDERVAQETFRLESLCVMPAWHPLADKPVIGLQDFQDQALIRFETHDPLRMTLDRLFEQESVQPKHYFEVSLALQATRLVRRGQGIAILDPINARAFGTDGLALRPLDFALGEDVALLTPRDQPCSQLTQAFIGLFRQRLDTQGQAVHNIPA
ncbi:LysR substrate-binding domain-containing protein [Halomonas sp. McH1-25]|uniref:LysR substrate-binding domain-containing protein n=1 Tax=unclassified Halomonas TaxID=2609666 RepID=UPI001EF5E768|nr:MULTISPECIES: LysR substrate-binding domain-containing protein [unclassified Halomonas]MCG7599904.1 LysR substrate-binding domain-containing protein [Halomonas sp. McH1-25]MCP1342595.1 LysR substrate-binding domain-containing protein [Halomonas sp. FL8]MCP1363262.1 LysR substrate-binding domain-containing protein [Halomonas sp. BBD45]